MSKIVRTVEPWTNDEGQVIQPGDSVFAFRTHQGRLSISLGVYLGYIETWEKKVQVSIEKKKGVVYLPGSDVEFNWLKYRKTNTSYPMNLERRLKTVRKVSTLNYNRIYLHEGMTAEKLASLV